MERFDTFSLGYLDVACEGGWGVNPCYGINPACYVYASGFTEQVNTITRAEAIVEPLFTKFAAESSNMHSTNLFTLSSTVYRENLRAKFLADAIPAISFAAGANVISGIEANENFMSFIINSDRWPRTKQSTVGKVMLWEHSDLKKIAYFFVHPLYRFLIFGEINE